MKNLRIVTLLIVPFLLSSFALGATVHREVSLRADFTHGNQVNLQTHLRGSIPMEFEFGEVGSSVHFRPDLNGCLTAMNWSMVGDQELNLVGPVASCLVDPATNESHFNSWIKGTRRQTDIDLVIPLERTQTSSENQSEVQKVFTNSRQFSGKVFNKPCATEKYRALGEVIFEPKTLLFEVLLTENGRVEMAFSAERGILDLNADTWDEVRQQCDSENILPIDPPAGQSIHFSGDSRFVGPDPATLSASFGSLRDGLRKSMFDSQLREREGRKLGHILDKVNEAFRRTRFQKARLELFKFESRVNFLIRKRRFSIKAGQSLLSRTDQLRQKLNALERAPLLEPAPGFSCSAEEGPCPPVSDCTFTVLHVSATADATSADGTRLRPFPTIRQALKRAEDDDLCGVDLRISPGIYSGSLSISRHTKLLREGSSGLVVIEGSIENNGPYFMELRHALLIPDEGERKAGITATNSCSRTRLQDVRISGFPGYGIRQSGGSLSARHTMVRDTEALPNSLSQGTGIFFDCGVEASISNVQLIGNESGGISLADPDTTTRIFNMVVEGSGIHPELLEEESLTSVRGLGAVQVLDGARLEVTGFRLRNNTLLGINTAFGGRALFDSGEILRTWSLREVYGSEVAEASGINVGAYSGGHITMTNFLSSRASLCGVQVALDGEMDLLGVSPEDPSVVSHSTVGACVAVPDYDIPRLSRDVVFEDNDINLDSVDLPIPDPAAPPSP